MKVKLGLLLLFLFVFRLLFGLSAEFWFEDELQIYLIGLKSFTTHTWPYYGPDLVYTNTQISGALQGLLIALPLYVLRIPEAPTIFLNLISFGSFSLLAWYLSKRYQAIPVWVCWVLVMTTPWAMRFSTHVVNPSYVIVFAIPFVVCAVDLLPIFEKKRIPSQLAYGVLGICTTLIMQVHMSWVLLLPMTGVVFLFSLNKKITTQAQNFGLYVLGLLLGAATLIPTLLLDNGMPSTASNIVFNIENWKNLPVIILRFFSFASNEIPYVLGGTTAERLDVVKENIWMAPMTIFLLIMGFVQVGVFVFFLFKKSIPSPFKYLKWFVIFCLAVLFLSFFFSVKGPSSHTFCILFPLAMCYAFYCYEWLITKYSKTLVILKVMAICSIGFHVGLGWYNFNHKSLYTNRQKVVQAITKMDYTLLDKRRADEWGYGY